MVEQFIEWCRPNKTRTRFCMVLALITSPIWLTYIVLRECGEDFISFYSDTLKILKTGDMRCS